MGHNENCKLLRGRYISVPIIKNHTQWIGHLKITKRIVTGRRKRGKDEKDNDDKKPRPIRVG